MVRDGWEPMNKSENPWLSQVVGGGTISGCFWRTTPMVRGSRTMMLLMMMIPKKNHQQSVCERDVSV